MDRKQVDIEWRKSRLAARLLIQKTERGRLSPRRQALANRLADDRAVTNRLINQALHGFYATRKHAVLMG